MDIDVEKYLDLGYLHLKNLLSQKLIYEIRNDYEDLVDSLISIYSFRMSKSFHGAYLSDASFKKRFATLLGMGGREIIDHLDPSMNVRSRYFKYNSDLPSAQFKSLFKLNLDRKLLSVIKQLIGDEIIALMNHHFYFSLDSRLYKEIEIVRQALQSPYDLKTISWTKHVGSPSWYRYLESGYRDAISSNVISAWVPLSESDTKNGGLKLLPNSHKLLPRIKPNREELRNIHNLSLEIGDVVVFHQKVFIAHNQPLQNTCPAWGIACRYLSNDRVLPNPELPSFTVHSLSNPQKVIENPMVWQKICDVALDNLDDKRFKININTPLENIAKWRNSYDKYHEDPLNWLSLYKKKKRLGIF